jgi:hypothetical protein
MVPWLLGALSLALAAPPVLETGTSALRVLDPPWRASAHLHKSA